jgi:cell division protein FtsW
VSEHLWETRLLMLLAVVLTLIGIVTVYGSSSLLPRGGEWGASLALRQAMGAALGGIGMIIAARLDYRVWQRWAWPLMGVVFVMLLIPLLPFTRSISPVLNGARRWVTLGPVSVQPSEVAKFAIVVWTAMLAAKKGDQVRVFKRGLLPFLVILGPLCLMVFLEPNLSMALLLGLVGGVVIFTAGARIGHFLVLALAAAPFAWRAVVGAQYRLARVLTFLNSGNAPSEATWQVRQSLLGIGAGGFFGVGFGQGQQKLGYLPYAYSDFIFSSLAEEWGFVGVTVLLSLFAAFVWLGFRIARRAQDPFARYLAVGITAGVGLSAVLHVGVNLALLPPTGLALPFVSYGRSSLMIALIATGVLASIDRRPRRISQQGRTSGALAAAR